MSDNSSIPRTSLIIYLSVILAVIITFNVTNKTLIELPLFCYWHSTRFFEGLLMAWPIFLWAFTITLLSLLYCSRSALQKSNPFYAKYSDEASTLFRCVTDCIVIGITEEILFRWLSLYANMVTIKITDYLLFGLSHWLYLYIEAPLINFFCLKRLSWLLYDQKHWSIGAAAIVANAAFRDAHLYLGIFGWYNSWCIGFFLFWIMSNYGIFAAICTHALYDFIIFFMFYVHGCIGRRSSHSDFRINKDCFSSTTSSSRLEESVWIKLHASSSIEIPE